MRFKQADFQSRILSIRPIAIHIAVISNDSLTEAEDGSWKTEGRGGMLEVRNWKGIE